MELFKINVFFLSVSNNCHYILKNKKDFHLNLIDFFKLIQIFLYKCSLEHVEIRSKVLCFFIFTAFKNACTVIYFYKYVKWNDLNKLI